MSKFPKITLQDELLAVTKMNKRTLQRKIKQAFQKLIDGPALTSENSRLASELDQALSAVKLRDIEVKRLDEIIKQHEECRTNRERAFSVIQAGSAQAVTNMLDISNEAERNGQRVYALALRHAVHLLEHQKKSSN